MKKVRFNNKVDVKYYNKNLEKENYLETYSTVHSPHNYKYIIGLILFCLLVFLIIYLTI